MQKRGAIFVGLMSLITLGIYAFYWLYKTKQELVAKKGEVPRMSILFYPLFFFVLSLLLQFLSLGENGSTLALFFALTFFMLVIPSFIGIWFYWFYKYCKAVEKVSKGKITFNYSFLLLIVLSLLGATFVWTALIQYEYNKLK